MYRVFETLPGLLSWATIMGIVMLSWLAPAAMAVFIIAFDTYWFLKSVYLSVHLRASFRTMRERMSMNWRDILDALEQAAAAGKKPPAVPELLPARNYYTAGRQKWRDIHHLIIFPMYNEPYTVVRESFANLVRANYPKDRMLVVLATEGRVAGARAIAGRIREEFGRSFSFFLITEHPSNLPGEIPGKGSNETWAVRQAQKEIDRTAIPYENILVSVLDVDTQVLPEYFGVLTYTFLTCEHPQRSSFQPVPLFTNNVYASPAIARVIAFSASFWHLMQQSRPERLTTFSSHAMPFRAVTEIGFWQTDVVSEDSRIFWQCFFHYDGDWRVAPIFYPVSMDANTAPGFWRTMKNIYKQQRRWGWGCENIPYMLEGFRTNTRIPWRKKLYWSFQILEGFHSWATNALIIFSLGWLPLVLGGPAFRVSVLSFNLPRITRTIMTIAMSGIVSSAVLSIVLLPPKPPWFRTRHYILYFFQWILTPVTLIVFGALPALEAQTRLMLGGRFRLGFWATPKFRGQIKS